MARYKVTKEQLERIVENFVIEAAAAKAPVKNHIPSQGAEAKKHVKNKITGKIVEPGEGVPATPAMKKKLSQAPEAKKHMSNAGMKHTNKAKVVKEEEDLEEGLGDFVKNIKQKTGEYLGTKMSKEKAEQAYKESFARNMSKNLEFYTKKHPDNPPTAEELKKGIIEYTMEYGGVPILAGMGKNAEWDNKEKKFKRISGGGKSGGSITLNV